MINIDIIAEQYNDLPYSCSMHKRPDSEFKYSWNKGIGVYKRENGYYPDKIVNFTLKKFVGKHVDIAFSAYCKKVTQERYQHFYDELEPTWKSTSYYLDEDGIICKRPDISYRYEWVKSKNGLTYEKRATKGFYIRSYDYKEKKVHKVTGLPYNWYVNDFDTLYLRKKEGLDMFEDRIVKGEERFFKTKGTAYKRYKKEQEDKARKLERLRPKELPTLKKLIEFSRIKL